MGDELYDAASNGAKRLEVTADGDSLHSIFKDYGKGWQGAFVKTLRFGGTLNLIKVAPGCQHVYWVHLSDPA